MSSSGSLSSDDNAEIFSREKKNCEDEEESSSPRSDVQDTTTCITKNPGLSANITQDRGFLIHDGKQFQLEEDIFSMIFLAPYFSASFVYAMLIFGVQITILCLALINLLNDPDPDGNIFMIPPYTPWEVNTAQLFAILISVFVSNDVVASLDVFLVKYDKDIQGRLPGASYTKWILSNIFRFLEGLLGILVAFVFIVQSDDVLKLFLDFSAVQFVSELDNVGYYIADKGYVSFPGVKDLTESMKEVKMKQINDDDHRTARKSMRLRKMLQFLVFYCTMAVLYALWAYVKVGQLNGIFYGFECHKFMIKMPTRKKYVFFNKCRGERNCPDSWESRDSILQYTDFNGLYEKMIGTDGYIELHDNRPMYRQISSKGNSDFGLNSPPGIIKYCENVEAWVFAIEGVSKGARADDCSWLLKSPETEVLSLDKVPEGEWQVWAGAVEEGAVDITCVGCTDTKRADGQTFDLGCNYHGECNSDKTCTCEEGFAGTTCSMCSGCVMFKLNNVGEDDIGVPLNSTLPENYKRLDKDNGHPLELYDNLVYYHAIEKDGKWIPANPLFTFFYWGDQYVFWDLQNALNETVGDHRQDLVEFLLSFHSAWDFQKGISEPLYVSQDTNDRWDEMSLKWRRFEEYEKNPDFSIGQYFELGFQCVEEEATFSQCPYLSPDLQKI